MDNIVQGSDDWHKLRLGKVTASRVADVIAKTKTGYSASRANYAAQLVTERLTGLPTEGFTNAAMRFSILKVARRSDIRGNSTLNCRGD